MRVAIVTNTDNGKGLQRDAEILTPLMAIAGCEVSPVHYMKAKTPPPGSFDVAIFLEVAPPRFFDCAPVRWLVPNPEWWEPGDSIAPFHRVLCKTADAERIFRQRADAGGRVRFLGFESACRRAVADPDVAINARPDRRLEFLHVAGGSSVKGTQTILEAWERFGIPHRMTVVTSLQFRTPRNRAVTVMTGRVPEARLVELQRSIICHLQPSEYEGFGHVLHEGLSAGACVLTTDAEPMRSADGVADLVRIHASHPMKSARAWKVSPESVAEAVARVAARSSEWFEDVRVGAIRAFEASRAAFRDLLAAFLAEVGR